MTDRFRTLLVRSWNRDGAVALLRIWLGIVMIVHGNGKFFGDKTGFSAKLSELGFPASELFAWLAATSEFVGGILLVVGLFSRPAALFVAGTMIVAAFVAHFDDPFSKKELALTYLVSSLVILIAGPGKMSLDNLLFGRRS